MSLPDYKASSSYANTAQATDAGAWYAVIR
jgi:hypothetical protein